MADAERKMCRRGRRKETKFRSDGAIARCGISKNDSNGFELIAKSCLRAELHMRYGLADLWCVVGPS
eukprot:2115469-Prymnesium_polylepis.1